MVKQPVPGVYGPDQERDMSAEAVEPEQKLVAEELARRIWGYFKGGPEAMQWFDNNKSLGGPAHIIDLCQSALAHPVRSAQEAVREAFRAGWKVNAVGTDVHPQAYLDGCEEVDWQEYQRALLPPGGETATPPAPVQNLRGDLGITKEWFERRAKAEADLEIGAGFSVVNVTDADAAQMEVLAERALPQWAQEELSRLRAIALDMQAGYIEATERAEEAVRAANALQVEVDRFRALYPLPQSTDDVPAAPEKRP